MKKIKLKLVDIVVFSFMFALLLLMLVFLFVQPYFEVQLSNRCTQGQATYWEAVFLPLQITNCK
jgi:hypothetical protein